MRTFEGYRRGVNLGGWLSQLAGRGDAHFDTFITEVDIERMAGWGLDHVRLPIDCDVVFAGQDGQPGPRMAYVDKCLDWCEKRGMKVVLDLHKTYGYMFDTAAVPDADAFFQNAELQEVFLRLWRTLARRYGARNDLVAFELLNEVTNPERAKVWNGIAARAVETIRADAPDSWILIGGVRFNSPDAVPLLDPPRDGRIVYNFHCYAPMVFTHQKAGWVRGMRRDFSMTYPETVGAYQRAEESLGIGRPNEAKRSDERMIGPDFFERIFRPALETAERYDVPLYCGEYGVIDQAPAEDTVRWYRDIHSVFEEHGIGRAAWTYKARDFGLVDAHYDAVRDELIRCL